MHNIFSDSIHADRLPRYSFFCHKMATILFSLCIIVYNCTVQLWDPVYTHCAELCAIVAPACIMRHCTIVDIEHIC